MEVFSPSGARHVNLTDVFSPVVLAESGLSGLVGSPSVSTASSVGVAGQVVTDAVAQPVEESLSCFVQTLGLCDVAALVAEFRGMWSSVAKSVLVVSHPRLGRWSLPVRLSGALSTPVADPTEGGEIVIDVPLVGDGGVWLSDTFESHGSNIVTVTNSGDVPVSPKSYGRGPGVR